MRRRALLAHLPLVLVPAGLLAAPRRTFHEFSTLTTEEDHDGYRAWLKCRREGRSIDVYLDGRLMKHVASSCERAGFVRHALEDQTGSIYTVWSEAYQDWVIAEEVVWGEVVHKIGPPTRNADYWKEFAPRYNGGRSPLEDLRFEESEVERLVHQIEKYEWWPKG